MKKIILSTATALLLSTTASADFIGAEAGAAVWSSSLTGTIKGGKTLDTNIDLEDNLGYGTKETNNFFWVYIDHPVPLIPNIKVQQTNLSSSGSKATTVKFDGKTYTSTVKSKITLNQTDFMAYYRLLDNWVNFDLGFNFKALKGNIQLSDDLGTNIDKDFEATIPMLYAKARFDLPFSGLSVEADGSYISFNGSKLTDAKAGIVYESSFGLGATVGVRQQKIIIDDVSSTNTDIDTSGMYAGLFYHF